ncbi:MAG: cell division protein DIVIC [Caldibacillus debilis]|nr:MAG: cell division protein DIVIC [Caldibacillus debilis]
MEFIPLKKGGLGMAIKNERARQKIRQSYMNHEQVKKKIYERRRKLLIRRLTAFFAVAFVVLYFYSSALISQSELLDGKRKELEAAEKQYEQLKDRQAVLKDEIKKLQDEEYIGKFARKEYFLSGENEIIFAPPDEEEDE